MLPIAICITLNSSDTTGTVFFFCIEILSDPSAHRPSTTANVYQQNSKSITVKKMNVLTS